VKQELSGQEQLFKNKLDEITKKVHKFVAPPTGESKETAARTCNDLKEYNPELKSGFYWIDPNRGCSEDAVKVHCNFENVDKIITCVAPTKDLSIPKAHYESEKNSVSADKYFSEDHNLGSIEYIADFTQLKYLGLLSNNAFQNITIHCKNRPVWFNQEKQGYGSAMKFKGMKEQVFEYSKVAGKYTPKTLLDDCSFDTASWRTTILEFNTNKYIRLPIVDFAPSKIDNDNAEYGMEMGPVCFY
jgi:hypothetical protein